MYRNLRLSADPERFKEILTLVQDLRDRIEIDCEVWVHDYWRGVKDLTLIDIGGGNKIGRGDPSLPSPNTKAWEELDFESVILVVFDDDKITAHDLYLKVQELTPVPLTKVGDYVHYVDGCESGWYKRMDALAQELLMAEAAEDQDAIQVLRERVSLLQEHGIEHGGAAVADFTEQITTLLDERREA